MARLPSGQVWVFDEDSLHAALARFCADPEPEAVRKSSQVHTAVLLFLLSNDAARLRVGEVSVSACADHEVPR